MNEFPPESSDPIRPREAALIWLAASAGPPRQRARDQQSDLAGVALRNQILRGLVDHDPEPAEMERAIEEVVTSLDGQLRGPARSLGLLIMQEWESVRLNPGYWEWQMADAIAGSNGAREPKRKRTRGEERSA